MAFYCTVPRALARIYSAENIPYIFLLRGSKRPLYSFISGNVATRRRDHCFPSTWYAIRDELALRHRALHPDSGAITGAAGKSGLLEKR